MKQVARPGSSAKRPPSFPIVGIGASAGGLEAFTSLLTHFPADTGMSLVLVQHLDPMHASELTRLLARTTTMPTREVTNNLRVEPNQVYVIPPNANMIIADGVLKLEPRPKGRRPPHAIDFFFESLAQDQGEHAIGVVLSGTATDGTLGLEAIKTEGGITFAQDGSARYDSMPRSAIAGGYVDFVLSPENIAKELAGISRHPYTPVSANGNSKAAAKARRKTNGTGSDEPVARRRASAGSRLVEGAAKAAGAVPLHSDAERGHSRPEDEGFRKVILLLRNHCNVDFALYKSTTIRRRIARRMVLSKQKSIAGYAGFLRGNTKELGTLFSDVLISVTSFFRNPDAFDALKKLVFPELLKDRVNDPVRVWVLGCSTGQEAYSIAMALTEAAEAVDGGTPKIQIFATDLNDALLDKARAGLYAKSIKDDVSPERLQRFFVEEETGYRVIKPLRQAVVFARQNLVSDPPFSRIDLICCRNLLIYLDPILQRKALPTFHYALRSGGYLFLGASESIGQFGDLFTALDKKQRIFAKKPLTTARRPLHSARTHPDTNKRHAPGVLAPLPQGVLTELSAQHEADRLMVSEFAPPGVLINADLQIVQFRGPTSAFLAPPRGKASFDLLKMARPGLVLALRVAVDKALKNGKAVRKDNIRLDAEADGTRRMVSIEVIPLKNLKERCCLILFRDTLPQSAPVAPSPVAPGGRKADVAGSRALRQRAVDSERELTETRDYLQAVQEQHEAASEELQASNEEAQSANEELQSINEELETSKEELEVGSSRVDLQACKLEYSIVSPK